jgi:hypothetical protein
MYPQYSIANKPSLWSSIKKGLTGVIVVGFHYFLDALSGNPNPQERNIASHVARTTGFALILDSAFEISTEGLLHIQRSLVSQNSLDSHVQVKTKKIGKDLKKYARKMIRSNTQNHSLSVVATDNNVDMILDLKTQQDQLAYMALLRYKNIARTSINAVVNLFTTFKYLINLRELPNNISPFSLSWPRGTSLPNVGPIFKYINVPLANPVAILLLSLGTIYNLREFSLSVANPYPRRAEGPILGLINSFSYIGITAELVNSLVQTKAVSIIPTGTSIDQWH